MAAVVQDVVGRDIGSGIGDGAEGIRRGRGLTWGCDWEEGQRMQWKPRCSTDSPVDGAQRDRSHSEVQMQGE